MSDFLDLPIADVADQVQAGTLTARAVTEAALARIERGRDLKVVEAGEEAEQEERVHAGGIRKFGVGRCGGGRRRGP